jgi:allantoinase
MAHALDLDLVIKSVRVVRPNQDSIDLLDVGIKDGKFAKLAPDINTEDAKEVFDAEKLLGFPGLVDPHMHVGIYNPLAEDAISESQAAAMGGVTTSLNYYRTGRHYLNRGGPYGEIFPDVLEMVDGNFYVDYGYHVAPISSAHIDEMEMLATQYGIPTFKIFMFYGGYGPHGPSEAQNEFLMIDPEERYDIAHFEFVMRRAKRLADMYPEIADYISVSLHCEVADILKAYTNIVKASEELTGLAAYSAAHPPHAEGLAIWIGAYLAHETKCPSINLLHLSSRKALEAASAAQSLAKINPPIRPPEDVEYLWQAILDGKIDWIGSDHACCSRTFKLGQAEPPDIWSAKAGFGGTEYLLSGVYSEGTKRGLSANRIAELLSWNAAQSFGLLDKGDVAVGYDADLVLFDPDASFQVAPDRTLSSQDFSPLEGLDLGGQVRCTFLRGKLVFKDGNIVGQPRGRYLRRPYRGLEG